MHRPVERRLLQHVRDVRAHLFVDEAIDGATVLRRVAEGEEEELLDREQRHRGARHVPVLVHLRPQLRAIGLRAHARNVEHVRVRVERLFDIVKDVRGSESNCEQDSREI